MKKEVTIFVVIIFFLRFNSWSQPLTIQWAKCLGGTLGDEGWGIRQTTDGNYIGCGEVASNDGDVSGNHSNQFDGWVFELDSNGNFLWQRCYGGSNGEIFYSMELLDSSGFIAAGVASSHNGDVIGIHNPEDYWVVRGNDTGAIQWQKCLGGSGEEVANQIIKTNDHGFALIGFTNSSDSDVFGRHDTCSNQVANDAWIVKLDSVGTIEWAKCYGGCWGDMGRSIVQAPDSGYIFVGSPLSDNGDVHGVHGAMNGEANNPDYWVVKINRTGDIQWQKCLGGYWQDEAYNISVTRDGGCILTGYTASSDGDVVGGHGGYDIWITKLDGLGNLQWQKCLGGSDDDFGWKIKQTQDGGYLSLNHTYSTDGDLAANPASLSDVWLVKLDSSGSIQWQQTFGGSFEESALDFDFTSDGGCVFIGLTNSNDGDVSGNHGDYDVWVVKLDPLPNGIITNGNPISDFACHLNKENQKVKIRFYENQKQDVEFELLDLSGRTLLKEYFSSAQGFNSREFSTGYISSGIYFSRIITAGGVITKKTIAD